MLGVSLAELWGYHQVPKQHGGPGGLPGAVMEWSLCGFLPGGWLLFCQAPSFAAAMFGHVSALPRPPPGLGNQPPYLRGSYAVSGVIFP